MTDQQIEYIARRLAWCFDQKEVCWKPQTVSGNRALAVAYIDARLVQRRLDEVMGVAGWKDRFEMLPDGGALCELSLKFGDEWVTKSDVGGPSDQKDGGDRTKAAVSDALKRAAVKFGVGRYLYDLPLQWVDYDPTKRQFAKEPQLPDWAVPPTISADQEKELVALAKEHKADWGLFSTHYCLKRMGELPLLHLEDAKARVVAGRFKKAETKTAAA